MHQTVVRTGAVRPSLPARGHSLGAARAPRMVRGYDAAGKVLFTAPASKSENPSARKGMDANLVRMRIATHGARLVRVEVDSRSGTPDTYLVDADGSMHGVLMVDGRVAMRLS